MLTERIPGIGYVEPYRVVSTVIMNKTYARSRIGFVIKHIICPK